MSRQPLALATLVRSWGDILIVAMGRGSRGSERLVLCVVAPVRCVHWLSGSILGGSLCPPLLACKHQQARSLALEGPWGCARAGRTWRRLVDAVRRLWHARDALASGRPHRRATAEKANNQPTKIFSGAGAAVLRKSPILENPPPETNIGDPSEASPERK